MTTPITILLFCMFWLGIGDPADFSDQLDSTPLENIADPVERWEPLVAENFPAEEVDTALCIIEHESGGDPGADNPRSSARGLFQILGSLWAPHFGVSRADLYDPVLNAELAGEIWEQQGWWAWSPYKRGACR